MQFELQQINIINHQIDHTLQRNSNRPLRTSDHSCRICYLVTEEPNQRFTHFWDWITNHFQADTYSSFTVTIFPVYLTAFELEDSSRTTEIASQLLLSIRYLAEPLQTRDLLLFLFNLTIRTDNFSRPVSPAILNQLTDEITTPETMNNQRPQQQGQQQGQQQQGQQQGGMNPQQLQTVLQTIFGNNGQNITALTQQLQIQQPAPRELTLIKIEPFYGKDEEDPHEWVELFNQAATANRWPDN